VADSEWEREAGRGGSREERHEAGSVDVLLHVEAGTGRTCGRRRPRHLDRNGLRVVVLNDGSVLGMKTDWIEASRSPAR
jgi:hypothetical protein